MFPYFLFWEHQKKKSGETMNETINETTEVNTNETSTTISIPTSTPPTNNKLNGPDEMYLFGRKIIYADYKEEDINANTIAKILNDVFSLHLQNSNEIDYLEKYYKGYQPIFSKEKEIRPTINNIVVENNAYFVTEFKKSYVFGEPIQYVQRGDVANEEVSTLNSYMLAEGKYTKDTMLAESLYISGIGHRLILPEDTEDSPFYIENLDSKKTFCVYSSFLPHKKLFACTYAMGVKDRTIRGSIYTKNSYYTFTSGGIGQAFDVVFKQNHIMGIIPIFEYYLNQSRLGIIEVILSILNALNRISSNDLDGLEQFVQSILVFINNDIDAETYQQILDMGAVKLNTTDPSRPADVKQLTNTLEHANTKVLHDRLFNTALNIVGIPKNSDKASGGDTGQARLLGEGWTMADERAKQDEAMFKECAKEELRLILRICKLSPKSNINTLTLKDVEQKFTRNKSDNFLVKSQGLMNQIQSGVSPDVAMTTSGLYSDTNEAFNKSMEFYGGREEWIRIFASKAKESANKNNDKNSDGSLRTTSTSKDASREVNKKED